MGTLADKLVTYSTDAQLSYFFINKAGYIFVSSYGAVGDGVTDDTESVQNAIDAAVAAGKTEVHFVGGKTYLLGTLTSTDGLTFIGDNVTITGTSGITVNSFSSHLADNESLRINVAYPPNGYTPVILDGVTDNTTALQTLIDAGYSKYEFPSGVCKYSTITINRPLTFVGLGNKHHCNINVNTATGIQLSDIPSEATVLFGTSLTTPALNITANTTKQSGLKIEGFVFYQEHSNYSSPTNYPYIISDENSTSYWSGLTIKDCLFINSWKGINLTKAERFDITDINADFFNRGFNFGLIRDVSKLERIHIWNFAKSINSDSFRQSLSSDYAIYMNDVDEIYCNDIFIWDRYKGIYTNKVWGSFNNITMDRVGKCFYILDPTKLNYSLNNIKLNSENLVQQENPIEISGSTSTTIGSVSMSDVVVWYGGTHTYNIDSAILINNQYTDILINNINIKYAKVEGIKINAANTVTASNILLSNYFPNQTGYDLTTVGIRNESTTAIITLKNIIPEAVKYVFDGYCEKLTLNNVVSVIGTEPRINKTVGTTTPSITDGSKQVQYVGTDNTSPFTGMRILPTWSDNIYANKIYMFGIIYKNSTILDTTTTNDDRFMSLPRTGANEFYIPMDKTIHSAKRLTVVKYTVSTTGVPSASVLARTFSGTTIIYESFICQSEILCKGIKMGKYKITSTPTGTSEIWEVSDELKYSSPTSGGNIGLVCTTQGSPGTWKDYGVID